jgi:hypothetical protein
MTILNIHVLIGIIFLVLHTFSAIDITYEFKQIYPNTKVPKSNWAGRILSLIKTVIIAVIPIFNIALCWVYIFKYNELKAKTIDKVYAECIAKEKKDVTHLSETSDR